MSLQYPTITEINESQDLKYGKDTMWLRRRGGRTLKDVLLDDNLKRFVYMGDGKGGVKRVYLPDLTGGDK